MSGSIPSSPPTAPPPAAAPTATPAAGTATATPPTAAPPQQPAPQSASAPTPAVIQSFSQTQATVAQLPATLAQQLLAVLNAAAAASQGGSATIQIQGQVLGKDQSGQVLVKTEAGTVALKLQAAQTLPQGASVTLQVGGSPAAPTALVVAQNPSSALQPGPQTQPHATAPPPSGSKPVPEAPATQLAPALQNKPSAQISATVVSSPQTPPLGTLPAAPTGTTVQLRLLPEIRPTSAPLSAASAVPSAAPSTAPSAAPALAATITAKIVAHLPGGQTLLETPIGRLAANWPPGLPRPTEGATLAIELKLPPVPGKAAADAATLRTGLPLAREWPTLKEALKTLGDAEPGLARRLVDEALPRPGPKLALQILSFLATDRSDARSLLGENIANALERAGKGEILQRLDGDLKEMQRQAASAGDWRVTYVPFQDGGELRQMRIFARREEQKDKRARDSKRFVVEVEFSELGDVQIDGLMRKPKLELMLRTHKQIPADLRDEIEVVFLEGCSLAGLAGKIYFQAGERFPVNPLEDIQRQTSGMIA